MFTENFSLYEAIDFRMAVMFKTACGTLKLFLEYSKFQRFRGKRECFPHRCSFPREALSTGLNAALTISVMLGG